MEALIRDVITKQGWTLKSKKLFEYETWPTKQHGGRVAFPRGRSSWKWDNVEGRVETERFFQLWTGLYPFFQLLTPDASWHEQAGAFFDDGGQIGAKVLAARGSDAVENSKKDNRRGDVTILKRIWDSKSSQGIPVSALLQDAIWQDDKQHHFLFCKTSMIRKLRHVARRIAVAPKFAFSKDDDKLGVEKKFVALVLAREFGWNNLTKWQMVEVLSEHGVPEEVDQTPPIFPSGPENIIITHSLSNHHIPSLTARQARRSAISQEALRERWV